MAHATKGGPCAVVYSASKHMRVLLRVRVSEMAAA